MTTQTPTAALQAIPPSDPAYGLAQTCLAKITIAANTTNTAMAASARGELAALLQEVVATMVAAGTLPAATVLAALPRNVADCGVTGTMNLATINTVGVY
jgi:hypothetical protein